MLFWVRHQRPAIVDRFKYVGSSIRQMTSIARISVEWTTWSEMNGGICDSNMAVMLKEQIYKSTLTA